MTLRDGRAVFCRPVKPEDAPLYEDFFASVDPQDLRLRFFSAMQKVPPAMIASLTQIDYARAMAFLAIDPADGRMMGVGRLSIDANGEKAEYAVMARSDLQGLGVGRGLMERIISYGREIGLTEIWGEVLPENRGMLALCRKLGFESEAVPGEGIVRVRLPLGPGGAQPADAPEAAGAR
ncbi:MAG: GNAT family N-acetyltransferase, partial [Pseudomonadota bacterium]